MFYSEMECFFLPYMIYRLLLIDKTNLDRSWKRNYMKPIQVAPMTLVVSRGQFHGSAYRKHRIGAYGSREFRAYGKRISRVSG